MIYLDNAATTRPKPPSVAEAVAAAMNDYGNSGRGTHPEALEAARSIYGVRQALAALFGCSRADRVAFTTGTGHGSPTASTITVFILFSSPRPSAAVCFIRSPAAGRRI